MEIRDYEYGDEQKILELFNLTFKRPMSPEYWRWRFIDNPVGGGAIKLIWDKTILAGHYAVSPTILSINGDDLKGSLSMTTMTHPDYMGQGIFTLLANALYSDLHKNHNHEFVMGFPNLNSHYGFLSKLRWVDLGIQNHLFKRHVTGSSNNYTVSEDNTFSGIHVDSFKSCMDNNSIFTKRSIEYLNWRYLLNPIAEYKLFNCFKNRDFIGFIIVKKFNIKETGEDEFFIVENSISYENMIAIPDILDKIGNYFNRKEFKINMWLSFYDKRHIQYEKLGFSIGGKPTMFGIRVYNDGLINRALIEEFRHWRLSYGDSDIY